MTKALSVLLIDDNPARAEIVESGLRDAGYVLLERLEGTYDLLARVATLKPDVIVVSIDSPSRDAIEDLRRTTEQQPRPIALFADRSDPATIAAGIYVGKRRANHGLSQDEINHRLVALARAGKSVVRLKGGDPFVFGRGGEEIEALARAGVAVEVVPGITAALGCAASAGIPLTHRDHAQACIFVTGHLKDGSVDLDWQMLARPRQTVVIYMGASSLPAIASQLVAHGMPPSTPVALIENGTTDRERRIVGTLATIERLALRAHLQGTTLCMVGEVVGLAMAQSGEPREFHFESRVGL